jgi:hypothetical protein
VKRGFYSTIGVPDKIVVDQLNDMSFTKLLSSRLDDGLPFIGPTFFLSE